MVTDPAKLKGLLTLRWDGARKLHVLVSGIAPEYAEVDWRGADLVVMALKRQLAKPTP